MPDPDPKPAGAAPAATTTAPAIASDATPGPSADPGAALAATLDRVGDRWSLLLVEALLDGPRRFGELGEAVVGIAPNILTARLRRLEREAIVRSFPYSTRPLRMEYGLTAEGRELAGALRLLADWGARHAGETAALRHEACGTPLQARWWCPTCDRSVEGVETDGLTRV